MKNWSSGKKDLILDYLSLVYGLFLMLSPKSVICWSMQIVENCNNWIFFSSSQKKVDPFISTVQLPHPFKTGMNKVLVFTEVHTCIYLFVFPFSLTKS